MAHARILYGRAVRRLAIVLLWLVLTAPAAQAETIGQSVQGRPIGLTRVGDGPRKVLVVGCIHGTEPAGRAIVKALKSVTPPAGTQLLLITDLNPDGLARGTRQNARGVDLNRNASVGHRYLGPRGSTFHSGPKPFSEPETRAIRALVLRERPAQTLYYHQALRLVDPPERGSPSLARAYARRVGLPLRRHPIVPGGLSRWQNVRVEAGSAFVVELPAGPLPEASVRRHVRAVLALG